MSNRRVQKRLDTEQFYHFGTAFVKEDRETGKVVQKPCLFFCDKVAGACNLTVAASATSSRVKLQTRATKSPV